MAAARSSTERGGRKRRVRGRRGRRARDGDDLAVAALPVVTFVAVAALTLAAAETQQRQTRRRDKCGGAVAQRCGEAANAAARWRGEHGDDGEGAATQQVRMCDGGRGSAKVVAALAVASLVVAMLVVAALPVVTLPVPALVVAAAARRVRQRGEHGDDGESVVNAVAEVSARQAR